MIRRETDLPVAVGFGISNAAQARQVASLADAVVVGSAIVRRIGEFGTDEQLARRILEFVQPLVDAVKSGRRILSTEIGGLSPEANPSCFSRRERSTSALKTGSENIFSPAGK